MLTARKALAPVPAPTPEETPKPPSARQTKALRRDIRKAWKTFQEAVQKDDKDYLRALHIQAKAAERNISLKDLKKKLKKHEVHFKPGYLIDVRNIKPELILVEPGSLYDDLYKIARGYWSMPYSKGYGRRLRYVVYDTEHQSVMGIIGLQSPPADLACRDSLLDVERDRKLDTVNSMLDAFTIGALPPYSAVLGGKLVAGLVASDQIRRDYWRIYGARRTLMQDRLLPQPLSAVTTSSAFGRSSIYNRLKFHGRLLAEPIGYTKGYGLIHLEHLYPRIESWLRAHGEYLEGGFGNGPKIRWQNITNALLELNLPSRFLSHGLKREVFMFRHISNLDEICQDRNAVPRPVAMDAHEWSDYWKERWARPRGESDSSWLDVDTYSMIERAIQQFEPVKPEKKIKARKKKR